ncbi:hypothetical protein Sa4125_22880 [Aureimonas sp. SA4125]|nr:hypothetical protein Sa4125_22880 [Aureimonas sp. SA4125]
MHIAYPLHIDDRARTASATDKAYLLQLVVSVNVVEIECS